MVKKIGKAGKQFKKLVETLGEAKIFKNKSHKKLLNLHKQMG